MLLEETQKFNFFRVKLSTSRFLEEKSTQTLKKYMFL